MIETQGVDKACRLFHEIRARDSAAVFFNESAILNYATAWGAERADDLIGLLKMNLEVYPRSSDSYYWLGQCMLSNDSVNKAADYFRLSLKMNPEHEKAQIMLEKISR